jgi:thiosulfate dehydrogenase
MRSFRGVVRAIAAQAVVIAACTGPTRIERGATLFRDPALSPSAGNAVSCATCHATTALSAPDWLPAGGTLLGVAGRTSWFGGEVRELRRAVATCLRFFMRHPSPEPIDPEDADGLDLLSYLQSLGTEAAPPVPFTVPAVVRDDLPPGDPGAGAGLWNRACAGCHGRADTGEGRIGPLVPIVPRDTLAEHEDAARIVTIGKVRHGGLFGYGGSMPPFALEGLEDQQLADVLAFLGLP